MLTVVAIVALIAATSAEIFEYSDGKYKEMPIFDPKAQVITATVINPDIKRKLERAEREAEDDTVSLFLVPTPNQENGKHPICKDSLGIDFSNNGGSTFCKLDLIRVRLRATKNQSGKHFMVLSLGFGFGTENNPKALEIPIFNAPSKYASPDQKKQLEKWASANGLATLPPFSMQQLNDLLKDWEISSDFNWLDKLVSLGIYKRRLPIILQKQGNEIQVPSYVSRPLVLRQDITTKLIELVKKAQGQTAKLS